MIHNYRVDVPKGVKKDIGRIPAPWQERLERAIDGLETNPFAGIKMNGEMKEKRKLVVWPYRVIYRIFPREMVVQIFEVGHRGHMSYK